METHETERLSIADSNAEEGKSVKEQKQDHQHHRSIVPFRIYYFFNVTPSLP